MCLVFSIINQRFQRWESLKVWLRSQIFVLTFECLYFHTFCGLYAGKCERCWITHQHNDETNTFKKNKHTLFRCARYCLLLRLIIRSISAGTTDLPTHLSVQFICHRGAFTLDNCPSEHLASWCVLCLHFVGLNAASPTLPLRNNVQWVGERMALLNLWRLHPYSSRRRLHRHRQACATGYPPVGVE